MANLVNRVGPAGWMAETQTAFGSAAPYYYTHFPNSVNRISYGRLTAPPTGAYLDGTNPVAGDLWVITNGGASYTVAASQRRMFICVTGGASPVWESVSGMHKQSVAFASTQTPDVSLGSFIAFQAMTGNMTINAPTNLDTGGGFIVMTFTQDGTGGRTVTWGSGWNTQWQPNPTPGSTSALIFVINTSSILIPLTGNPMQGIFVPNTNAQTLTNPSAIAAFTNFSYTFQAGALNQVGRRIKIRGWGVYTTAASQTPTLTLTIKLGALVLVAIVSTAAIASTTNAPFDFELDAIVTTAGASGALEAHGDLRVRLLAANGIKSVFGDANTAVVSTVDLTASQALTISWTNSSSNASNTVTLRQATIEVQNAA